MEPENESDFEFPRPSEGEEQPPVEIPKASLSRDALRGVIENFILREGTDYGVAEVSYDAKAEQIERQLDRGHIKIVFDPNTETVTLMTDREWKRARGL